MKALAELKHGMEDLWESVGEDWRHTCASGPPAR